MIPFGQSCGQDMLGGGLGMPGGGMDMPSGGIGMPGEGMGMQGEGMDDGMMEHHDIPCFNGKQLAI